MKQVYLHQGKSRYGKNYHCDCAEKHLISDLPDMSLLYRQRKSIRLKEYDYSQPGDYFVTICTNEHDYKFGEIVNEEMRLDEMGKIVKGCWEEIPIHFSNVELDEYVVMPNHVHGIIILNERVGLNIFNPTTKDISTCNSKIIGINCSFV